MACGSGAQCTTWAFGRANMSQVYCAGAGCFDITTDVNNCGACGNSCGAGGSCTSGMCTCATGAQKCGNGCADLMTDPNDCGMCGRRCGMGAVACSGGMCQTMACDGG